MSYTSAAPLTAVTDVRVVVAVAVAAIDTIPLLVAMKKVPPLPPASPPTAYHAAVLATVEEKDMAPRQETRATVQPPPGASPAAESYAANATNLPSIVVDSLPSEVEDPGSVARPPAAVYGICHVCTIRLAVKVAPTPTDCETLTEYVPTPPVPVMNAVMTVPSALSEPSAGSMPVMV